jgi:hypothetical protein
MNFRRLAFLFGAAAAVSACMAAGTGAVGTSAPSTAIGAVAAISRSNPSQGARDFLDACGITNFAGQPGTPAADGIGGVTDIGLIPVARDYAKYIPHLPPSATNPNSAGMPEWDHLDKPLWLAEYAGVIVEPMTDPFKNAICGMIDGDPSSRSWIGGDTIHADGSIETSAPQAMPVDHLPAWAP